MGLVFDNVVGTVEPEPQKNEQSQNEASQKQENDSGNMSPTALQAALTRLQQRAQRLSAD
jgi:hypothetical protein